MRKEKGDGPSQPGQLGPGGSSRERELLLDVVVVHRSLDRMKDEEWGGEG